MSEKSGFFITKAQSLEDTKGKNFVTSCLGDFVIGFSDTLLVFAKFALEIDSVSKASPISPTNLGRTQIIWW